MTSVGIGKMQKVAIREGLFNESQEGSGFSYLQGSRCTHCGEVVLGSQKVCANCGHKSLDVIPLSNQGALWTYTVIRHEPPGDYKGPKPFQPFGVGLVELPEGIRVLSVIDCSLEMLQVGMDLTLDIYALYQDENHNDVMTFRFKPAQEAAQ